MSGKGEEKKERGKRRVLKIGRGRESNGERRVATQGDEVMNS